MYKPDISYKTKRKKNPAIKRKGNMNLEVLLELDDDEMIMVMVL